MVYVPFWQLKERFGSHANAIRDAKYDMESCRKPGEGDDLPWWMTHPEIRDDKDHLVLSVANLKNDSHVCFEISMHATAWQDWELFRVFDSFELESTEQEEVEHNMKTCSTVDGVQTGSIVFPS